ncbi:hypothetical protein BC939DRAFT_212965 [Gamsiella multidivaricata]|uniref:uncharacterized protein n=1 Tax=Gamsiella multidivaricata TaxID=101098 RepID=UPI00221F310F|nr:uncharacterized protein BC939DRAFT_212965 [Gamsiella multidivaricata]KAI7820921.1 hypothetical protein BC939DRAFT_212965 [Gamsiella multidivaricata]
MCTVNATQKKKPGMCAFLRPITNRQLFWIICRTHRSDFRGFTLKPTKNVVEPTKQTSAASIQRPSGAELRAESTNRRKPVSNTQDSHPTTKGVLSNAFKELSIDRDSANKDTLEKPASSGDVNPRTRSEKFTRSTSRSAGTYDF